MSKYHYTYLLSNTELDVNYIGVRSSNVEPQFDTSYMSSSILVQYMMSIGIEFKKEIINTYETRLLANDAEQNVMKLYNAVESQQFLNFHSHSTGYTKENAIKKMNYFKTRFLKTGSTKQPTHLNKYLTYDDMAFCVYQGTHRYLFINHPEHLKHYYPSTKVKTYWPGRADKLLSTKDNKFYTTDLTNLSGTSSEQIIELLTNHYVSGQRWHIAEMIAQLVKTVPAGDEWTQTKQLIAETINDKYQLTSIMKSKQYKPSTPINQPSSLITLEQIQTRIKTKSVTELSPLEKIHYLRAQRENKQLTT